MSQERLVFKPEELSLVWKEGQTQVGASFVFRLTTQIEHALLARTAEAQSLKPSISDRPLITSYISSFYKLSKCLPF